jgi:serine phosphatase RsbU (regulator of sigma subunit)
VCSNILSKVVIEEKIFYTDKILNRSKALMIDKYSRSSENIYDGMDISLCCLNTDTLELNWSGANNPLYIFRNKELIELKPDKQPVGKSFKNVPFTRNTMQLEKNDCLYLFTDGFADQFGGEKSKKLKYKPFKELLQSIQHLPINEQEEYLDNFFNEWKGNLEQVDDVCIMGVKI